MPLDYTAARQRLENIRFRLSCGTSVKTPNGKIHLVAGVALHSETLECLLVIVDAETQSWTAIAPGAARIFDQSHPGAKGLFEAADKTVWCHKKGGVYTRVAQVRSKDGEMTAYASHEDGVWWLRPRQMFEDGRFKATAEEPLSRDALEM